VVRSLKGRLGRLGACAATLALGSTVVAVAPAAVASAASTSSATPAITASAKYTGTLASDGNKWIANVPSNWNGTVLLYSHGFGDLLAQDAPTPGTETALLARGYALIGSSYDPTGSLWALDNAVTDQFASLQAFESDLPSRPTQVLALGTSMGGLISALEDQDAAGRIDGSLTTCGIVAGEYAMAQLLLPNTKLQLAGFTNVGQALATAGALTAAAAQAQTTAAGRARLALAMAYLNVATWTPTASVPATPHNPTAQEAAEYNVLFKGSFNTLDFIEAARASITQADGGNANWTQGVNFAAVLNGSPYKQQVFAMYRAAQLNLPADLMDLNRNVDITADQTALRSLAQTSVPTGHLTVPELDLKTIGDQLVAVQQENFYAHLVRQAGDGSLLRQAFVSTYGHCNFSPGEIVAGLQALVHRVDTGSWGNLTRPSSLNEVATSLDLGPAQFVTYFPGPLTGAVTVRYLQGQGPGH